MDTVWADVTDLSDFAAWPGLYLCRHLAWCAILCFCVQMLMHAFTLVATLRVKRAHKSVL